MKKYWDCLRRCPLFEQIRENDLLSMLSCLGARVASFDKKYTILPEGSPAKYIGIMLSGTAQIVQVDYYGNRRILGNLEPSQMFAEAFACADIAAVPVSVIASQACEVLFIDSERMLHPCSGGCGFHQQLIFNLMRDLADKAILFHQKLEILSRRTTREKLMAYLMLQAKRAGSNRFEIPFDRQELADYLEVDRSGLSVQISKLQKEGILRSRKTQFELL